MTASSSFTRIEGHRVCDCGLPCLTSNSSHPRRPGRVFQRCPKDDGAGGGCGYITFTDIDKSETIGRRLVQVVTRRNAGVTTVQSGKESEEVKELMLEIKRTVDGVRQQIKILAIGITLLLIFLCAGTIKMFV